MRRGLQGHHVGPGDPVMRQGGDEVELPAGELRILHVGCKRPAAGKALDGERRADRAASAGDHQARPGRHQRIARGSEREKRHREEAGGKPRPGPPHADALFHHRHADGFGEPHGLAAHAGLARGQHPAHILNHALIGQGSDLMATARWVRNAAGPASRAVTRPRVR
jgi:hypothetical protein